MSWSVTETLWQWTKKRFPDILYFSFKRQLLATFEKIAHGFLRDSSALFTTPGSQKDHHAVIGGFWRKTNFYKMHWLLVAVVMSYLSSWDQTLLWKEWLNAFWDIVGRDLYWPHWWVIGTKILPQWKNRSQPVDSGCCGELQLLSTGFFPVGVLVSL
jgi:hypothetical protein